MSWCRWGSKCSNTIQKIAIDETCVDCPGSSLYIYESVEDVFVCCGCPLNGDRDWKTASCDETSRLAMHVHILEHDKAGHHVRKSLLAVARGETLPEMRSPDMLPNETAHEFRVRWERTGASELRPWTIADCELVPPLLDSLCTFGGDDFRVVAAGVSIHNDLPVVLIQRASTDQRDVRSLSFLAFHNLCTNVRPPERIPVAVHSFEPVCKPCLAPDEKTLPVGDLGRRQCSRCNSMTDDAVAVAPPPETDKLYVEPAPTPKVKHEGEP